MKKLLLAGSIIVATAGNSAFADTGYSTVRRVGVFFGSAIAGAAVVGPIGMVAAAASGVWLDEQVEKADGIDKIEAALSQANTEMGDLKYRLAVAEDTSQQYARIALEQLQLQMLFKTGKSELSDDGKQRIKLLADFMAKNTKLLIRLDGYADPRGDANYNLSLSQERVASVAEQLLSTGVEPSRISTFSHGASQSRAQQGDIDSYAMERVVRIQLTAEGKANTVAQATITQ